MQCKANDLTISEEEIKALLVTCPCLTLSLVITVRKTGPLHYNVAKQN